MTKRNGDSQELLAGGIYRYSDYLDLPVFGENWDRTVKAGRLHISEYRGRGAPVAVTQNRYLSVVIFYLKCGTAYG